MASTPTPRTQRLVRLTQATLVAALIGAAGLTAFAHPQGGRGDTPPPMGGPAMLFGGPPGQIERHLDRWLDGVKATDAQRTQIKQIAKATAADLQQQRGTAVQARQEMARLFKQPQLDAAAIEAQRQALDAQHSARSQRLTQALIEVGQVLTPEQRVAMADAMGKRGRGEGGPGRGRGPDGKRGPHGQPVPPAPADTPAS